MDPPKRTYTTSQHISAMVQQLKSYEDAPSDLSLLTTIQDQISEHTNPKKLQHKRRLQKIHQETHHLGPEFELLSKHSATPSKLRLIKTEDYVDAWKKWWLSIKCPPALSKTAQKYKHLLSSRDNADNQVGKLNLNRSFLLPCLQWSLVSSNRILETENSFTQNTQDVPDGHFSERFNSRRASISNTSSNG